MSTHDILHRLSDTLLSRRDADPSTSYTAQLFAKGPDSILKKIGEECAELIMASKDGKQLNIVRESADVIYHVLVLLAFHGLGMEDVSQEMRRREGISGIDEKRSRLAQNTESVVLGKE
ncbi:MAG: phosphoribosyl-ATP diphosphatase [Rhodocyclaceae bacterium]|nr:phosphoribosyl-ATP diphosphatase [Rhodocyclaceae bacterium]